MQGQFFFTYGVINSIKPSFYVGEKAFNGV